MGAVTGPRPGSYVDVDLVLPRFYDDLWPRHGAAIRAAEMAAIEAQAATVEAMGTLL